MTLTRTSQIVYGARSEGLTTKSVVLTKPVAGVTTQEDANQLFDQRIKAIEESGGGPPLTEIDGGTY